MMKLAALIGASMAVSSYASPKQADDPGDFYPAKRRGKGQNNRRGKGRSSPPKKRSNRLTISKRVRRKHRRAA